MLVGMAPDMDCGLPSRKRWDAAARNRGSASWGPCWGRGPMLGGSWGPPWGDWLGWWGDWLGGPPPSAPGPGDPWGGAPLGALVVWVGAPEEGGASAASDLARSSDLTSLSILLLLSKSKFSIKFSVRSSPTASIRSCNVSLFIPSKSKSLRSNSPRVSSASFLKESLTSSFTFSLSLPASFWWDD